MKFRHLIPRKIFKFVATRCQILRLKYTKFNFGWGSAPDPSEGAYSAPDTFWLGLRGLLLREGEGTGNGRVEGEMEERKREGRKENGTPKGWFTPHVRNPVKYRSQN